MASILLALLSLAFIGHLLYARAHNTQPLAKKYPVGTEMHELYSKFYTREFLVAASLITYTLVFSGILSVLELALDSVPSAAKIVFLITGFIASMLAASALHELFKKKPSSKN